MVTFYDIKVVDGVLTALAVNESTGLKENITAKIDGSYHSSTDSDIIRATWGVVWQSKKKGNRFPETITIAWG